MKTTLTFSSFIDGWPESRKNSFSYQGFKALYAYFSEYEEETGEQLEFDPVAIDCEYTEYSTAKEAADNYYSFKPEIDEDEELTEEEKEATIEAQALEFLQNNTQVIEFDGGIIISNF